MSKLICKLPKLNRDKVQVSTIASESLNIRCCFKEGTMWLTYFNRSNAKSDSSNALFCP